MAQAKVTTADDGPVNGLSAVNQGDTAASYDGRAQILPSGESLTVFAVTNDRYLSGSWEGQ